MNLESLKERQKLLQIKVEKLLKDLPEDSPTGKQLQNHLDIFNDSISYLLNPKQKIAFIGKIGVGKTSAICKILGLMNNDKPVLSTGSGRTTICEVEILEGNHFEIKVTPYTDKEVKDFLDDYALQLMESNKEDRSDKYVLNLELRKALRNMLGFKKIRDRDNHGKRKEHDTAKEFSEKFDSAKALSSALKTLINLPKRKKVSLRAPENIDGLKWLQDNFRNINYGKVNDVGLPKRIKIVLPKKILINNNLDISVIDTKGVDQTVDRMDLLNCIKDKRTVTVLCSSFNDAPDADVMNMLRLAKSYISSQRISSELLLLVLDKHDEAENVTDIDEPVGDKELGREIRKDDIISDNIFFYKFEEYRCSFF